MVQAAWRWGERLAVGESDDRLAVDDLDLELAVVDTVVMVVAGEGELVDVGAATILVGVQVVGVAFVGWGAAAGDDAAAVADGEGSALGAAA